MFYCCFTVDYGILGALVAQLLECVLHVLQSQNQSMCPRSRRPGFELTCVHLLHFHPPVLILFPVISCQIKLLDKGPQKIKGLA